MILGHGVPWNMLNGHHKTLRDNLPSSPQSWHYWPSLHLSFLLWNLGFSLCLCFEPLPTSTSRNPLVLFFFLLCLVTVCRLPLSLVHSVPCRIFCLSHLSVYAVLPSCLFTALTSFPTHFLYNLASIASLLVLLYWWWLSVAPSEMLCWCLLGSVSSETDM